jgi:hypothetical protein
LAKLAKTVGKRLPGWCIIGARYATELFVPDSDKTCRHGSDALDEREFLAEREKCRV